MINTNSFHSVNPHFGRRPSGALGMPDPSRYPDWTPGDRDPRLIGMPDPSKYPNYKPGRTLDEVRRPEHSIIPNYDKYPRDKPGIMGGWDAPMFHDGRVMTRREFAQLSDLGLA